MFVLVNDNNFNQIYKMSNIVIKKEYRLSRVICLLWMFKTWRSALTFQLRIFDYADTKVKRLSRVFRFQSEHAPNMPSTTQLLHSVLCQIVVNRPANTSFLISSNKILINFIILFCLMLSIGKHYCLMDLTYEYIFWCL